MQRWKCTNLGDGSWGFEKGKVYSTNKRGELIDFNGSARLTPERYNSFSGDGSVPEFKKHIEKLENK